MGWKTDTIRVSPATIRRASESSSSRNGGGSGWGPVPGAWGLVLTARQRNNAAAGLFVGTEEADVVATQAEKPSAASGEAKPKTPTARGDAKEGGPQPAPPADRPEAEADGKKRGGVRSWIGVHRFATIAIVLAVLASIAAGVVWGLNARHYEDTDDAFIDARPSAISAQVAAAITDVPVTDNEIVSPGQILARLDNRDYLAAQTEAKAQIAEGEASIASAEAQTKAQQSAVDQASEQVTRA